MMTTRAAGLFYQAVAATHQHVLAAGKVPPGVQNIDATVLALVFTFVTAFGAAGCLWQGFRGHIGRAVMLGIVALLSLGILGGSAALGQPISQTLRTFGL